MSPSPNRYHQEISRNLEFILLTFLQDNATGELFHSPFDVYLSELDVFQPDIVFVANDRLSILTEAGAEGAPTLVIEILSPGTAARDRKEKKDVYTERGVEEMWIIDPDRKTIEIFRLQENPHQPAEVFTDKDVFGSTCFPGLEICASRIFRSRFAG